MKLKINEIFYSIQGESTYAGLPCIFIRLTYCNLRCTWCDSEYTFKDGQDMSIPEIISTISNYNCNLVQVTGGEPLVQKNCIELLKRLDANDYQILLETGGSLSLDNVPKSVIKIVDFKCPGSGMEKKNLWSILDDIDSKDEIKFVIKDKNDFKWAESKVKEFDLDKTNQVIFSPVFDVLKYETLAEWIKSSKLNIRMQIQLHKHIWSPELTGV
ncbi:MAG: radical SAM protein [Candidatus Neomarinimicrobiota bacterium]|jgi:7-carboxy-7-deazaguanine synthase|nr:radical SAM protein [Candidatus Neomarinimicrobiota bacterium]